MDIFRTKNDIPWIFLDMNAFSAGKCHVLSRSQNYIIRTANPFPYAAKFMFDIIK